MLRFILSLSLVFVVSSLTAQDIHFSQFYNSPLVLNPANTGVFYGEQRIRAMHRNQWSNIVPWETVSASYDRKFIPRFCQDVGSFFSGGILLNYDRSSDISDLTMANINLTGSYTAQLDSNQYLTFGTLLGVATRGFAGNNLTWDSQWDDSTFDFNRGLTSGENFDAEKVSYFETGVGINYRWQKSSRTKVDIGAGMYHFVEPGVGYYDITNIKLARRYTLTAVGQFETCENMDLQGFAMMQVQGRYQETVVGVLKKIYLDQQPGRHLELHLGIGHRFEVAWFPILAVQYNNFYGSISYDMDATNIHARKGVRPNTIELHFGYEIANPKWEQRCPIY